MNRSNRLPLGVVLLAACWCSECAGADQPTARDESENTSTWNVLGRSLEQRVIEYRQFGTGKREVLVVGPLEGDSNSAVELVESLAKHLERFPKRTNGVRVTLLRDPNPDGRLRRRPTNARGVSLDRNFPTRDWRKIPSGSFWLSGREPESEPETRALVELFDDLQPDRIVILGTAPRGAELIYAGAAEELARDFAKSSGLRPHAANPTAEQGSLAVYAGVDRNLPTLVLRVPAGMPREALWATYKRGLLAVIGGETTDSDINARWPSRAVTTSRDGLGNSSYLTGAPASVVAGLPSSDVAGVPTAPPHTPTTLRGISVANSGRRVPTSSAANVPPVLSDDELQLGGELAPVVRVPRTGVAAGLPTEPTAAAISPRVKAPTAERPAPRPQATIRANTNRGFPPAVLARPAAKTPTLPALKTVERLPAVDKKSPPSPASPQPIPLYPATGY
jgi:protein MpaA